MRRHHCLMMNTVDLVAISRRACHMAGRGHEPDLVLRLCRGLCRLLFERFGDLARNILNKTTAQAAKTCMQLQVRRMGVCRARAPSIRAFSKAVRSGFIT